MKLTRAASYAIKAVVHIAREQQPAKGSRKKKVAKDGKEAVASDKIAEERHISPRFLLKVLKPLVGAQILKSVKGPNGGYSLARPAKDITLLEVIEAANQAEIRAEVSLGDEEDPRSPLHRRLEQICTHITEQTRRELTKTKISDLITK